MRTSLAALAAAIQQVGQRPALRDHEPSPVRTCWLDVDHALGGVLRRGVIHEWFGEADDHSPPHAVLIHLAQRAARSNEHVQGGDGQRIIWIGRSCWPHPRALVRNENRDLLNRSVFVDPSDEAARLWAIDHALRSAAITAVIADGHGIDMAQSRRLQLAAEAGGTLALIARPPHELDQLSAAFTRWRVSACVNRAEGEGGTGGGTARGGDRPRWTIELLRCKGMRPSEARPCWVLELDRAKGIVSVPADVGDRSRETLAAEEPVRRSA